MKFSERTGLSISHLERRQHTVRYTELSPTRFKDFWRNKR